MNYPPKSIKEQYPGENIPPTERRWFDAFVIGSIDPIIVFDETLNIRFINQNGALLFGKRTNELIGINIEECDAIGSIVAPVLQDILKLKTGMSCDHEIPEENHLRVFQGSYSPVLNADNRLLGIFSVLREVTDRRDMLRQLIASNKRLESHVKTLEVFDIVSESDLSGQILYVNDRFCEITQYSRDELVGKNYRMINSGTHSKAFFQEVWETISRGQPWFGELKNRAKDSSTFWSQTIITPILNDNGSIVRFLSIQQDITRERDERFRIAGASLRFRQILDSNPLMVAGLDLEQNVLFCNKALLEITGYKNMEVVEKKWFETFVPADEKQAIQTKFLKLFDKKYRIVKFDSQIIGKDGGSKNVTWHATVIKNQEEIAYGIHLLGEEKKEDTHETDILRQDLIGFVSHELKGGLISIESGLQLIQDKFDEPTFDQIQLKSIVTKILSKVTHIEDLSRNMMENLKLGSQPVKIHAQPISLRTVLSGVWNRILEETPSSHKLIFNLQLPKEDITVQWDPLKIEQMERNLLSNAIQYSKPLGGTITLLARQTKNNILIGISDDGIGVPPESLESIFNLFTRGMNTEQQQVKHFGIGLKLCKDIVSQHRGRLWIESKLNFGTTIFILLPIDPRAHSPLSSLAA